MLVNSRGTNDDFSDASCYYYYCCLLFRLPISPQVLAPVQVKSARRGGRGTLQGIERKQI